MTSAVALEMPPSHSIEELAAYTESLGANSPVSTSSIRGTSPLPLREMDPSISAMLKDVEFLLDTVLALPQDPSAWQVQKVQSMSKWVHGRLSGATEHTSSAKDLHRAVRLSSLMYCRAVQARKPFTRIIKDKDVVDLVDAVCKIPLEEWNDLLRTLIAVLAVVLPKARGMPQCYPTRVMMMAAAVHLALVDWSSVASVLSRILKLQAWLLGANQE